MQLVCTSEQTTHTHTQTHTHTHNACPFAAYNMVRGVNHVTLTLVMTILIPMLIIIIITVIQLM